MIEIIFFPQQPFAYFEELKYQFTHQSTQLPVIYFNSKDTKGNAFYCELENGLTIISEHYTTQHPLKIQQTPNFSKDYLVVRFIKTNLKLTLVELDNHQFPLDLSNDESFLITSQDIGVELLSQQGALKNEVRIFTFIFSKEWLTNKLDSDSMTYWFSKVGSSFVNKPLTQAQKVRVNSLFNSVLNQENYFVMKRDMYDFLIQLLGLLKREDVSVSMSKYDMGKIEQVHDSLIKNLTQAPTIEELSQLAEMSPSKLKNLFKLHYGVPIYSYFLQMRLKTAKELLETGRFTVGQVSLKMGYSQPTKFIVAFKKKYNTTPFAFRNNVDK